MNSSKNAATPPVVCTLTLGKRAERELEWSDIASLALSRQPVDGGIASTFSLAIADKIEDLANRELSCCGTWLQISHQRRSDDLLLTLTTTNPEGEALIRSMSGLET